MEQTSEPGSFRDPRGFVFRRGGTVFRQINRGFEAEYRLFAGSPLYRELIDEGLLVAHEEVDLDVSGRPEAAAVIRPVQIPFISYPYEWCFSQYKAAALLTLEIQRRALARGFVLRDASAYNVQFLDGRAVFIDTLSFGAYVENRPWVAYRQFCQHFLAPLALMAMRDASLGRLMGVHIDGVPLDVASRLQPVRSRLKPGLAVHLHAHARARIDATTGTEAAGAVARRRMSRTAMAALVDSLTRTVRSLSWKPSETTWSTYTDHWNYTAAAQEEKRRLVGDFVARAVELVPAKVIWDVGANTGAYSRLAVERIGARAISFDGDHASVERHFGDCTTRGETRILPLVQDLTNPSPGLGWHHCERQSLAERGPADITLALALVHHLAVGANVPLVKVAGFFRDISRCLVVEFVPKEDSQIEGMLALREDTFPDYSREGFESAFGRFFDTVQTVRIEGTSRTLYLMVRRS